MCFGAGKLSASTLNKTTSTMIAFCLCSASASDCSTLKVTRCEALIVASYGITQLLCCFLLSYFIAFSLVRSPLSCPGLFSVCTHPCIYIAPFVYFVVFSCPFLPCSALFCLVTIIFITSSTTIALQTCTVCITK